MTTLQAMQAGKKNFNKKAWIQDEINGEQPRLLAHVLAHVGAPSANMRQSWMTGMLIPLGVYAT